MTQNANGVVTKGFSFYAITLTYADSARFLIQLS